MLLDAHIIMFLHLQYYCYSTSVEEDDAAARDGYAAGDAVSPCCSITIMARSMQGQGSAWVINVTASTGLRKTSQ